MVIDVTEIEQLNNVALRGCLECVLKDLKEIHAFAVANDFVGDMLIAGCSYNAIDRIEYVLKGGKDNG